MIRGDERYWANFVLDSIEHAERHVLVYEGEKMIVRKALKAYLEANDRKTEPNSSEKPNNCKDLQDWKDRMWAEAIVTEPQTIRCPKCGRTDYIRDMEKDMGIKGSSYKYKCINCNTYIKDEPQTERSGE